MCMPMNAQYMCCMCIPAFLCKSGLLSSWLWVGNCLVIQVPGCCVLCFMCPAALYPSSLLHRTLGKALPSILEYWLEITWRTELMASKHKPCGSGPCVGAGDIPATTKFCRAIFPQGPTTNMSAAATNGTSDADKVGWFSGKCQKTISLHRFLSKPDNRRPIFISNLLDTIESPEDIGLQ